jgi:hypothetical protein
VRYPSYRGVGSFGAGGGWSDNNAGLLLGSDDMVRVLFGVLQREPAQDQVLVGKRSITVDANRGWEMSYVAATRSLRWLVGNGVGADTHDLPIGAAGVPFIWIAGKENGTKDIFGLVGSSYISVSAGGTFASQGTFFTVGVNSTFSSSLRAQGFTILGLMASDNTQWISSSGLGEAFRDAARADLIAGRVPTPFVGCERFWWAEDIDEAALTWDDRIGAGRLFGPGTTQPYAVQGVV